MVEKGSLATLRVHSIRSFPHRNLDSILQFIETTNGDHFSRPDTLDGCHTAVKPLLFDDLYQSQWGAESSEKSSRELCLSLLSGKTCDTRGVKRKSNTRMMVAARRQYSWTESIPASLHTYILTQHRSQLCD